MDYLVPFKHFNEYTKRSLSRRIDDEDMQKRYAHYKEKFAARQLAQFFTANKEKEWFQEKYHPKLSLPRFNDIKSRRKRYLNNFLEDLEKGEFDDIQYDKEGQATTENTKNEEETETEAMNADDSNAEYETRLVIKTVPPTIAREKIIEVKKKKSSITITIENINFSRYRCVTKLKDLIIYRFLSLDPTRNSTVSVGLVLKKVQT